MFARNLSQNSLLLQSLSICLSPQVVRKAVADDRERVEFADKVDQVVEDLERIMKTGRLLQFRECECLGIEALVPGVAQLSRAVRDQSTLEEAVLGRDVDDLRNKEFHRVLAKMEGVEKRVLYRKAYRTCKLALLTWMCDREVALREAEDDVVEGAA